MFRDKNELAVCIGQYCAKFMANNIVYYDGIDEIVKYWKSLEKDYSVLSITKVLRLRDFIISMINSPLYLAIEPEERIKYLVKATLIYYASDYSDGKLSKKIVELDLKIMKNMTPMWLYNVFFPLKAYLPDKFYVEIQNIPYGYNQWNLNYQLIDINQKILPHPMNDEIQRIVESLGEYCVEDYIHNSLINSEMDIHEQKTTYLVDLKSDYQTDSVQVFEFDEIDCPNHLYSDDLIHIQCPNCKSMETFGLDYELLGEPKKGSKREMLIQCSNCEATIKQPLTIKSIKISVEYGEPTIQAK